MLDCCLGGGKVKLAKQIADFAGRSRRTMQTLESGFFETHEVSALSHLNKAGSCEDDRQEQLHCMLDTSYEP